MPLLLALSLGASLVAVSPLPPPAGLLVVVFALSLVRPGRSRGLAIALILGAAWTTFRAGSLLQHWLPADCERVPVTLRGHVASIPETSTAYGDRRVQRFLLDVSEMTPMRCAGPRRVRLSYFGDSDVTPGDTGEFHARLRVPWGTANPGAGNREAWFGVNGVHAVGSVRHLALDPTETLPWRYRHHVARWQLLRALDDVTGDERAKGLLMALTVGARHQLAQDDWRLLRELGVVHLVVISGLHVSLAGAAGALLGRVVSRLPVLLGRASAWLWLPGFTALASATTYAALAGFSLPTIRALVMLAALVAAVWLGRDAASPRTLLLAVFVLILLQPLSVVSAGFWLSVGAVASLLWFLAWQPRQRDLATPLRVHLYLCVAMLPLTAWWFGSGSVIAPVANAIAVPLVGLVVVPATLLASVLEGFLPEVTRLLWQCALALLGFLLGLADAWSEQAAGVGYRRLSASAPGVVSGLLAVALLGLPMPLRLRLASACLLLPLLLPESGERPVDRPELAVLDVGQGTSVVVTDGERTLVYDTGGGDPTGYTVAEMTLIPFLQARGVRVIDTLLVSHADRDHSAGTRALMRAFVVRRMLLGESLDGVAGGEFCRTGTSWSWPSDVHFRVLAGGPDAARNSNDRSCVLLVDLAGHRFLLPGDISGARERDLVLYWREALASDWLLAAHHGSGSSTTAAWLRAVRPHGVILTHARANPFGHPHADVMARFARRDIETLATARDGAIVFRAAARGGIAVTRTRAGEAPFWHPPASPGIRP